MKALNVSMVIPLWLICGAAHSAIDNDGDGYVSYVDCDDNNPAINPGAPEICDGVDNNCDGNVDEGVLNIFYTDGDGDGYGDSSLPLEACVAPAGHSSIGGDCDDGNASIFPGAEEVPGDGIDQDCDGSDAEAEPLPTDTASPDSTSDSGGDNPSDSDQSGEVEETGEPEVDEEIEESPKDSPADSPTNKADGACNHSSAEGGTWSPWGLCLLALVFRRRT